MTTPRTYPPALCLLAGLLLAAPLAAQAPETQPSAEQQAMIAAMTPGSPHAFLAEQVGTWNATMKIWTDPAAPPIETTGTLEREMILGGRVLKEVLVTEFMGMPFHGVGHTGYDNVTGQYWSTWFDNLSTGVFTMTGTIDEATYEGTLVGKGPEAIAGKDVPMRLETSGEAGKQVIVTHMEVGDHGMMKTMECVYERQ